MSYELVDCFELLSGLSDKIGNSASVGFELVKHEFISPTLVFRIDWRKENFHFRYEFTVTRLLAQPQDVLNIVIHQAQKAFANRTEKE
jgi:hypothetical protein